MPSSPQVFASSGPVDGNMESVQAFLLFTGLVIWRTMKRIQYFSFFVFRTSRRDEVCVNVVVLVLQILQHMSLLYSYVSVAFVCDTRLQCLVAFTVGISYCGTHKAHHWDFNNLLLLWWGLYLYHFSHCICIWLAVYCSSCFQKQDLLPLHCSWGQTMVMTSRCPVSRVDMTMYRGHIIGLAADACV